MSQGAKRTPVLVGVGEVIQREDDPRDALEPVALMIAAARAAGADCGHPELLGEVGRIAVPKGRWAYADPARLVADAIGATDATTVLAQVGVLQQTLIGEACRMIAEGELTSALVLGGEAGFRILRGKIMDLPVPETESTAEPDVDLHPHEELRNPVEAAVGFQGAPSAYAVIETAFGAARGWDLDAHRDAIGRLYSGMSDVAAENPYAWKRQPQTADYLREPSEKNPMLAFPYTRLMISSWSVDQASAMLFCSEERATELGIDPAKWVYPWASTESNHMTSMSARPDLGACPGAGIAGRAALELAGLQTADIDQLDLYSCFPVAIELYAEALGIDPLSRPITVTGGMPFAGGPLNNYVFQATCRMAQKLRDAPGETGLVSCVSGLVTKQGFGVWSTAPAPEGFGWKDVTSEVDAVTTPREVVADHAGPARVAGYTVLHDKGEPVRGLVVADVSDSTRTVAYCEDRAVLETMEAEQFCGRTVDVADGRFGLAA